MREGSGLRVAAPETTVDEQLEFLLMISERLDGADISYMITGSVALAVYATPRMTRDIDLVVEIGPEDAPTLVDLFASDCFVDPESVHLAASSRGMFNIIHNEWIIKADFIVRRDDRYRRTEFERRRTIEVEGRSVAFVAPEDLVLSKLCWSRESGSELQERDVRDLLETVDGMDTDYLQRWAAELGVDDLLQRLSPG